MHEYPLGRQIAVLARLWRWELDNRLQPLDLSQARYVLLVLLAEAGGPLPQSDLAERAGITGPTLVRHLDQLAANGLVRRQDAPNDRRVKHVCLTDIGLERCRAAERISMELREELVSPFHPEAVREAQALLSGLARHLESLRAGAVT